MLKQAIIFTFIAIIANYNCSAMNNNPEFLPNEEVLIQTNDESYDQGIVKRLCSKLHCTHAANGDNLKPICEDVDQEDYDCSELECFQDSIGTIMCQNCQDRKAKKFYLVYDYDKNVELCLPGYLLHSTRY